MLIPLRILIRILLWLLKVITKTSTDIDNLLNAHGNTSFSIVINTYVKANTNLHDTDTNINISTNTNTNTDVNTPRHANNHFHIDINMYIIPVLIYPCIY